MTIAAGFRCIDGVVLAADTELTLEGTTGKTRESKIFGINEQQNCWLTYAGVTPFAKELVSTLVPAAKNLHGRTLENLIDSEYRKLIKKHWADASESNTTYADILVTIRNGERVDVYAGSTTGPHFSKITKYEVLGVGKATGESLFSGMYSAMMDVNAATSMAVYALRKAKESVQGVGGATEILWLEDSVPQWASLMLGENTEVMERDFDFFDKELPSILLPFSNLRVSSKQFRKELRQFSKSLTAYRAKRIREEQRNEKALAKQLDQER